MSDILGVNGHNTEGSLKIEHMKMEESNPSESCIKTKSDSNTEFLLAIVSTLVIDKHVHVPELQIL